MFELTKKESSASTKLIQTKARGFRNIQGFRPFHLTHPKNNSKQYYEQTVRMVLF